MHHPHRIAGFIVALILSASLWVQASASSHSSPRLQTTPAKAEGASHPSAFSDEAYEAILQFFQYDKDSFVLVPSWWSRISF